MSRKPSPKYDDEMRPEYDFTGGVRGKFFNEYQKGTNVVLLEPDVAEVFPDSTSVNEALRALARIVKKQTKRSQRKSRTA
ncbi:hypothetical protein MYX84_02585 [Acidobacteria bacterium AH-259-O06]|nr:hypothetical protein [Acidobacteria bacterium AH-259-O06]